MQSRLTSISVRVNMRFLLVALCCAAVTAASAPTANALSVRTPQTPEQIREYYNSGTWERDVQAVVGRGKAFIAQPSNRAVKVITQKVKVKKAGKVKFTRKKVKLKPAIVLDIDETSLNNFGCLDEKDFNLGAIALCTFNARGTAVKPVLELYKLARDLGYKVFFLSARPEQAAVVGPSNKNLVEAGYAPGYELSFKRSGDPAKAADYKAARRKLHESQGYRIVLNVGDQDSDLAGGAAMLALKLPNVIYVTT